MDDTKLIITEYSPKAIPLRGFDWSAWYDGDEEAGNIGYGPTEQAAINDLLINE